MGNRICENCGERLMISNDKCESCGAQQKHNKTLWNKLDESALNFERIKSMPVSNLESDKHIAIKQLLLLESIRRYLRFFAALTIFCVLMYIIFLLI
jgi:uncharacterized membrane protein YvbJ